jgi:hypothetical protein
MMRALFLVLALAGCKKAASDEPIQPVDPNRPAAIPATELKRAKDACQVLVDRACACGSDTPACGLAKGQVEAIGISLDLVDSASATHRDILQAQDSIRKTQAHCIEESTKPAAPCSGSGSGSAK